MRFSVILAIIFALTSSASADIRITRDPGGSVGLYLDRIREIKSSGERVIIDGLCGSACTLTLGLIRNQMCSTDRGVFGFHEASVQSPAGQQIRSEFWTTLARELYPEDVNKKIARQGGLTKRIIFLKGLDVLPKCRDISSAVGRGSRMVPE